MLFEALDQIEILPSGFYVMDFTKLEKLVTLKRMEGRGVEEDLGCRGRRRHHDGMFDKGRMNGREKKLSEQVQH